MSGRILSGGTLSVKVYLSGRPLRVKEGPFIYLLSEPNHLENEQTLRVPFITHQNSRTGVKGRSPRTPRGVEETYGTTCHLFLRNLSVSGPKLKSEVKNVRHTTSLLPWGNLRRWTGGPNDTPTSLHIHIVSRVSSAIYLFPQNLRVSE